MPKYFFLGVAVLVSGAVAACGSEQRDGQGASSGSGVDAAAPRPEPPTPVPDAAPRTAEETPAPARDGGAPAATEAGNIRDGAVEWRIDASTTRLTMAQREAFRLRIHATNAGAAPVQPQLHQGSFAVNGQRSMVTDMAFSNGVMEAGWMQLPPGQTVTAERALGTAIFPAPGQYVVTYTRGDASSTVTVRVDP